MSRFMLLTLAVLLAPAVAYSDEPAPAVVAVDAELSGDPRVLMSAGATGGIVSDSFSVDASPSTGRIWPELRPVEICGDDSGAAAARLSALISEGRRQFFEEMDGNRALESLNAAIDLDYSAPCLRRRRPGLADELCGAAVLAVRLYLLAGRPETASAAAVKVVSACSESEIALRDVPPDTREFIEPAVEDVASLRASRGFAVGCAGSCRDVFIDGRPVDCGDDACTNATAPVRPGSHVIAANVDGSGWYSGVFDWDGSKATVVVVPGTRALAGGIIAVRDQSGAGAIADILGVTVLGIWPGHSGQGWRLVATGGSPGGTGDLAGFSMEGESVRFRALKGSGLVIEQPRPWPWPWVSGSLSGGFLVAGIVLNVFAERALSDAESGLNTMARYEGLRAGAIAGYVTAGAGVLATILLAVLRPMPDQSVVIVPSPAGFTLNF